MPASAMAGGVPDVVPASHLDLVRCPPVAALSTLMASGYPQTSVVWCDTADGLVRVNTMCGFAKEKNMRRDPRVVLLCFDPRRPHRYLEVRGTVVEMTEDGAAEHLDHLASAYAGRPVRYFGGMIPARFAETEVPVLCLVRPTHVVAVDVPQAQGQAVGGASTPAVGPPPEVPVPDSHLDLLVRPVAAVLTTVAGDGSRRGRGVPQDPRDEGHPGRDPRLSGVRGCAARRPGLASRRVPPGIGAGRLGGSRGWTSTATVRDRSARFGRA